MEKTSLLSQLVVKYSYLCQGPKSASFSSGSGRGQKALFGRGAHNVFRVRLGKNFEKHELIINFEVIFDRCQVRYIK
jgi:hypothetical protein